MPHRYPPVTCGSKDVSKQLANRTELGDPPGNARPGSLCPLRALLTFLFAMLAATAASSQSPPGTDDQAIRALIADWYAQHRAAAEGNPWRLLAPGAIDASPGYRHVYTGTARLGPRIYTSLAATALRFEHEISRLDIDPRLARVGVWERAYYYAWAVQRTYERAGYATFVLEKQEGGRWLVLAHETEPVGIPPNRITNPMPDLRALFYSTIGRDRDPAADARAAGN